MSRAKSILASIKAQIFAAIEGREFCSVTQIVGEMKSKGVFSDDFSAEAIAYLQKDLVRQVMRRKGDDGYPLFPNIMVTDTKTGKKTRAYMRERRMRPPQYRQVTDYYVGYSNHGKRMANETIRRCNSRYKTQWELPFPEPDEPDVK